jgi:hypothetical protein
MRGSRAKVERRALRGQPAHIVNAQAVIRSAEAVLAVDLSDVVLRDRVPQMIVGLCRAAAAQSKVVATLTAAGMAASAAPNRRLFLEAAIRLNWLSDLSREDRRRAADIMLAKDRSDTNATLDYLQKLGREVDFDPTEMNAFELDAPTKGSLQDQARKLDAAVRASSSEPWSLYAMWREETKYAHPSGALAGQYAPTFDDAHIGFGEPDPMDPNLEAHRLIQHIIVMTTGRLLADEGFFDQVAGRIPTAFLAVS